VWGEREEREERQKEYQSTDKDTNSISYPRTVVFNLFECTSRAGVCVGQWVKLHYVEELSAIEEKKSMKNLYRGKPELFEEPFVQEP
jgi:hypothetical protein